MRVDADISRKTNKVLNLIILAFILILLRVWYLAFVQKEYHELQARRPQRKSIIERVERATIQDRFNIPLAENKISYRICVRYADLREIPSYRWTVTQDGKKLKEAVRSTYISSLAQMLSEELHLEKQEIEDLIYAKASLFPHTPFTIKENVSRQTYSKLRMLQKNFPGLEASQTSYRVYPLHKVACDVIGYMGSIEQSEYLKISEEIKLLEQYVQKRESGEIAFLPSGYHSPLEARTRLKELKEKSYTINDLVGKSGIEYSFDELLRGSHGKIFYEIDPKGNVIRKLPSSKKGISGKRIVLSISAELQEFAESLLAQHETFREIKDEKGERIVSAAPWIKGGAIVTLDPKNGEILALASYPRFDPNDFIPGSHQKNVSRWLENESHLATLWNGKENLSRETFSLINQTWGEEEQPITWNYFISHLASPTSEITASLNILDSMEKIYVFQIAFERLLSVLDLSSASTLMDAIYPATPHIACRKKSDPDLISLIQEQLSSHQELIKILDQILIKVSHNDDKLLILDASRLLMNTNYWTDSTLKAFGDLSPHHFFSLSQQLSIVHDKLYEAARTTHHETSFKNWRQSHFKEFLKSKRKEEKQQKKPTKPYIEYLKTIENTLFRSFWNACKYYLLEASLRMNQNEYEFYYEDLKPYLINLPPCPKTLSTLQERLSLLTQSEAIEALKAFRFFNDLTRPLYNKYPRLRHNKGSYLEKHLASAFYPINHFGYGRSKAFRESTPQGSVFKLAVAYEALKERYLYLQENQISLKELNPLVIVDQIQMNTTSGSLKQLLGYTSDGHPIHRLYKGGVLPRTHPNIGKIGLPGAIEQSSNIYFSLLAAEHIQDPSYLEKATKDLGLATKTGIDLPGEIGGTLPNDLSDNKSGLYSFAIGQHSLIVTPLQTAIMMSTIANQGTVLKPQIVHLKVGKQILSTTPTIPDSPYPFQGSLSLLGIHFPLFTESLIPEKKDWTCKTSKEVQRSLFFPKEVQTLLFEAMDLVISGNKGTAKPSIIRYLKKFPKAAEDYHKMKGRLLGKTGTAEIFYKPWLSAESKAEIRNHIWFAGIAFPEKEVDPSWENPELIVVVYLLFSQAGGKEAAPLAAQMATKWREIKHKHQVHLENTHNKGKHSTS